MDLSGIWASIAEKVITNGWSVLVTLIVFLILQGVISKLIGQVEKNLTDKMEKEEIPNTEGQKRIKTLSGIIRKTALTVLWAVGFTIILGLFGVQIGPIIAAAGVVGLAVGFGAQNLVRDLISGAFILVENQIRVGDVAMVNGTGGVVEEINLRTVVLRDATGTVHIFPNGTITTVANMTKDWSAFVIDMGVAYKEDPDQVMEIMKQVGAELKEDPEFKDKIIEDLEMMGVDNFGDSAVIIKARIKTRPIQQWAVGREYRRRLKKALDAAGVEIPFPHMSLYFGEESKPFVIEQKAG